MPKQRVALIGAGITTIGYLNALLSDLGSGCKFDASIDIFERSAVVGSGGIPYSFEESDPTHLLTIPASFITIKGFPSVIKFFKENRKPIIDRSNLFWDKRLKEKIDKLADKSAENIAKLEAHYQAIKDAFVRRYTEFERKPEDKYPRFMLGIFTNEIFQRIVEEIRKFGVEINIYTNAEFLGVRDAGDGKFEVQLKIESEFGKYDKILIATGMQFKTIQDQCPFPNYIGDVWPVTKWRDDLLRRSTADTRICIQGSKNSANDFVKSLFTDCRFITDESGMVVDVELVEQLPTCSMLLKVQYRYLKEEIKEILSHLPEISLAHVMLLEILSMTSLVAREEFLCEFFKKFSKRSDTITVAEIKDFLADDRVSLRDRFYNAIESFSLDPDLLDYKNFFSFPPEVIELSRLKNIFSNSVSIFCLLDYALICKDVEKNGAIMAFHYFDSERCELFGLEAMANLGALFDKGLFNVVLIKDNQNPEVQDDKRLSFVDIFGRNFSYDFVLNATGQTNSPVDAGDKSSSVFYGDQGGFFFFSLQKGADVFAQMKLSKKPLEVADSSRLAGDKSRNPMGDKLM